MRRRAVVCCGIAWNRVIRLERRPEPVPATVFLDRTIDAVGSSGAGEAMNFASLGRDLVGVSIQPEVPPAYDENGHTFD